jgi:hypothetical protein
MKYRIKKTVDLDGLFIYVPQFRWFFLYWNFWEVSFPPHKIFFRNYELAESFIKLQRLKPKDEFYYL